MKLQIVEYRMPNQLEGNIHYRYMLELDGRVVRWTGPSPSKRELKVVYGILTNGLSDGTIDLNIENYMIYSLVQCICEDYHLCHSNTLSYFLLNLAYC